jgi:hypothetical protein
MPDKEEELEIPAFMRKKIKDNKIVIDSEENEEDYPVKVELREGSVGAELEELEMDLNSLGKNLAILEETLKTILAPKGDEQQEDIRMSEPSTSLASQVKDDRLKVLGFIHAIKSLTERVDL